MFQSFQLFHHFATFKTLNSDQARSTVQRFNHSTFSRSQPFNGRAAHHERFIKVLAPIRRMNWRQNSQRIETAISFTVFQQRLCRSPKYRSASRACVRSCGRPLRRGGGRAQRRRRIPYCFRQFGFGFMAIFPKISACAPSYHIRSTYPLKGGSAARNYPGCA